MQILVYGFKPYHQHRTNISEQIVKALKPSKSLKTIVFPCEFDEQMFLKAINQYQPDAILGIGQCGDGQMIRIERKARGQKDVLLTGKIKKRPGTRYSYNAGSYVCNFSMMTIARNFDLPFAFIHIPANYNLKKAQDFIKKAIQDLT